MYQKEIETTYVNKDLLDPYCFMSFVVHCLTLLLLISTKFLVGRRIGRTQVSQNLYKIFPIPPKIGNYSVFIIKI